jgi:uncharacterized protein YndB with AHSA1/START domain
MSGRAARASSSCAIPAGNDIPCRGVYLEIVENERIVFTDAYTSAWDPAPKPFMTVILAFAEEDGKTRYTARVRHWTVADRETHEKMGSTRAGDNAPTSSPRWRRGREG